MKTVATKNPGRIATACMVRQAVRDARACADWWNKTTNMHVRVSIHEGEAYGQTAWLQRDHIVFHIADHDPDGKLAGYYTARCMLTETSHSMHELVRQTCLRERFGVVPRLPVGSPGDN